MKVSVVIRTKNEAKTLEKLLKDFREGQTFKDFEIVLVDNDSKDNTQEIAKKYKVDKIVEISDKDFTHPHSTNLGVEKASGDLVVILNGHVLPMTNTWLEDGLKNFEDPKVAGISGHPFEREQKISKFWKIKLYHWYPTHHWHLTTTNTIIRKKYWQMYKFDESLADCEDYDWAEEMVGRGFKIIKDPKFSVYHSHIVGEDVKDHWAEMRKMLEARKRPYKL